VVRAATFGLPLAVAIIGGAPHHFGPLVDLYRKTGAKVNQDRAKLKVCINQHGYIAETSQQAADEFYPSYAYLMSKIGLERGWQGMTREQYDYMRSPEGALVLGSPQQVIDKILYEQELFKMDRFLMQMTVGTMPHAQVMKSIELFGTVVAPAVKKALGS
jgi:alkanesulfonate monooxygenase SsuD/methylene tetrahydromethanopterin reductase-like flavin-dependent oxidoreductase (luciferase family)